MRVLIVEDNRKLLGFLQRAFSEEGYVVDTASTGPAAVRSLMHLEYDLVVLDWMIPEQSGPDVCREVRKRGNRVPILMLTARTEVGERIVGLDAGADDYLPKPFDLGELMARSRALMRRSATDQTLRVGALSLDRVQRKATLAGTKVELTPREFELLAYLVRAAGRSVPKTELLQKVWESSFDPESNVVEVHVRNLREKLGDHSSLIETVRGVGYRVVAE